MVEALVLLLFAALPLLGSPGPATLSIAATGSVYGVVRGVPYMFGVMLGTSVVVLLVATGVTGLLFTIPGVLPVISVAALGYILYLAYKIATAPILQDEIAGQAAPSMLPGFLLAIANPKAFAAIGAVFSSMTVIPDQPALDVVIKAVTLITIVASVNIIWLFLGASLSRLLRHPTTGRIINIVFAVALVLSVAIAALL